MRTYGDRPVRSRCSGLRLVNPASRPNQPFQLRARSELGSLGSRIVINFFFHHCPVEVVRAEAQRNLRDAWRQHDPIRFDVFEIVEH